MSKKSLFDRIRPGSRVTILAYAGLGRNGPEYQEATGRAVMLGPAGWVLNMGGRHGTPDIASEENVVAVAGVRRSVGDPLDSQLE
jgi:hypothetical protein